MSDQSRKPSFVGLSAVLTGVPKELIDPFADVLDLKTVFFEKLIAEVGSGKIDALLDRYESLCGDNDLDPALAGSPPASPSSPGATKVGDAIMNPGRNASAQEKEQANIASSIIKLWYLGSWYPATAHDPAHPEKTYFSGAVVSAQAYKEGWAWRMGQTHPMGYSQWEFGYWAETPPSLEDFVEGN